MDESYALLSQTSAGNGVAPGNGTRAKLFHTMSVGLYIFVPWMMFTVVSLFFTFLYHQASVVVWFVAALCAGVSIVFMIVRQRRPGSMYWFVLGMLCFLAVTLAVFLGYYNYQKNMSVYWDYQGQRQYSNVLPSEPALMHLDAGQIEFSSGSALDASRAVGYRDAKLYCVAPIVGEASQSLIEYWAAGVNCCEQRGAFSCDDANDGEARSGLVVLEPDMISQYQRATREAAAAFNLAVSQDALFVRWTNNPDSIQAGYWNAGVGFLLATCGIHLGVSVILALMLHFSTGGKKAKDGRLRA